EPPVGLERRACDGHVHRALGADGFPKPVDGNDAGEPLRQQIREVGVDRQRSRLEAAEDAQQTRSQHHPERMRADEVDCVLEESGKAAHHAPDGWKGACYAAAAELDSASQLAGTLVSRETSRPAFQSRTIGSGRLRMYRLLPSFSWQPHFEWQASCLLPTASRSCFSTACATSATPRSGSSSTATRRACSASPPCSPTWGRPGWPGTTPRRTPPTRSYSSMRTATTRAPRPRCVSPGASLYPGACSTGSSWSPDRFATRSTRSSRVTGTAGSAGRKPAGCRPRTSKPASSPTSYLLPPDLATGSNGSYVRFASGRRRLLLVAHHYGRGRPRLRRRDGRRQPAPPRRRVRRNDR